MVVCWQIIVNDKDNLSGLSVFNFLNILISAVRYKFVYVCNTEMSFSESLFFDLSGKYLDTDFFLMKTKQVIQFEWGDLFFTNKKIKFSSSSTVEMCFECLNFDGLVVRFVDNYLFYIYTKNYYIVEILKKSFNCVSIEVINSQTIEWPT